MPRFLFIMAATLICLYRENALAIQSEARYPNGGNMYYVTMQIAFDIQTFARKERNLHCDLVYPRGGPCQHGFMCGCMQWSNDIIESN